ncbi:MAG TPA: DUF4747 family protein, partial [Edaphobacter sp.]|nr:DUF4747 family protein [Edaphobacter sp.]
DPRIPNALTGRLFVFSKFNFDDPWLNTVRNAQATDAELEELKIPPHLVPEFRHFRYIFDVRKHKFYFEKYSDVKGHLSSKAFTRALNAMLSSAALAGRFDEINAYTVSDDEAVWPAPGSEDTRFGVTMGPEGGHAEAEVHAGVQA